MKSIYTVATLTLLATTAGAAPRQLAMGPYNANGIRVNVGEKKATVELGCASGEFARPNLKADGSFEAQGTMETDLVIMNKKPQPAKFSGRLESGQLRFWIEEAGNRTEYRLVKGVGEPLMKCK
jgi:hypothetical protein